MPHYYLIRLREVGVPRWLLWPTRAMSAHPRHISFSTQRNLANGQILDLADGAYSWSECQTSTGSLKRGGGQGISILPI